MRTAPLIHRPDPIRGYTEREAGEYLKRYRDRHKPELAVGFTNCGSIDTYFNSGTGSLATTSGQNVSGGNALGVWVLWSTNLGQTVSNLTDTALNPLYAGRLSAACSVNFNTAIDFYYVLNATGNASNKYTATFSANVSGFCAIIAFQMSGIATSSAVDVAGATTTNAGNSGTSVTYPTSGTFSTSTAGEIVIGCATSAYTGSTTFTAGTQNGGYTIPTNGAPSVQKFCAAQYNISGFTGTVSGTTQVMSFNQTVTDPGISVISFKPSGGASACTPTLRLLGVSGKCGMAVLGMAEGWLRRRKNWLKYCERNK